MRPRVPHPDPGVPDSRGPGRFLWWLAVSQLGRVLLGSLWGSAWMLVLMLPPYLVSRAVDDGLRMRDAAALGGWAAAILAVGAATAVFAGLRHRTMTFVRIDASYRTVEVVARHAVRLGSALTGRVSTGEVVNIAAYDVTRIAQTLTVAGPGVGAAVAYLAAAVLLLSISPLLAVVVLLGVPLVVLVVGPLLGRLQATDAEYREQQAALTTRAGDIVAGLRVLCGIGGKDRFAGAYRQRSEALQREGYRVGAVTSWIEALTVGLPALFLAAVTWLAARMAAAGAISVGEMVAGYGYVAALVVPVFFFVEFTGDLARGLVSARRVVRLLAISVPAEEDALPGPAGTAELHDPASGLVVRPCRLLAVVASDQAAVRAVVDRIGGYLPADVAWGTVPLHRVATAEVRRHVLVADDDASLFAGSLREVVDACGEHGDAAVRAAVHTAAADDVVAGLPDGLASSVDAEGRNLSGGQRQRLRLARAVLADPEVLVLVEPTSAVDAHTEALVAARLRAARAGRTTVLVTTSPLLLDRADEVAYLADGKVTAVGSHHELLASVADYRALVYRGEEAV